MRESKTRKNDYRSKYTQMIIKDTYLELLQQKHISKITVMELCTVAKINRGTFYNHFEDVYDVSYSIEQDFYEKLQEKLDSEPSYNFDKSFFYDIIKLLEENIVLVKTLIDNKSNSNFMQQIIAHIYKRFSALYATKQPRMSAKIINNMLTYSINGSIGIITQWVNENTLYTAGELAEIIERFNSVLISETVDKNYQK